MTTVTPAKTLSLKAGDISKAWYLVDAEGLVLGRMAAVIARILRGKHKPFYTPHLDCGDNVIVVNAARAALSGRKRTRKLYYRHSGYPGGIKVETAQDILEGKRPERLVALAVRRMLGRGPLGRRQFKNLRIYAGAHHPHDGVKAQPLDIAAMNAKNTRNAGNAGNADSAAAAEAGTAAAQGAARP